MFMYGYRLRVMLEEPRILLMQSSPSSSIRLQLSSRTFRGGLVERRSANSLAPSRDILLLCTNKDHHSIQ